MIAMTSQKMGNLDLQCLILKYFSQTHVLKVIFLLLEKMICQNYAQTHNRYCHTVNIWMMPECMVCEGKNIVIFSCEIERSKDFVISGCKNMEKYLHYTKYIFFFFFKWKKCHLNYNSTFKLRSQWKLQCF